MEHGQSSIDSQGGHYTITVMSHEHHGVSNQRQHDCLLISLIQLTTKETSRGHWCGKHIHVRKSSWHHHYRFEIFLSVLCVQTIMVINKQGKSEGFDSCDRPSNLKLDSNRQFFCPCDREIWWMTLQNNRAPLLCYFKLCASFCTHWWIQT